MKNKFNYLLFTLLITFSFSSCEDDPEPVLPMPTIENVEVGLNNNEIGVIGRDFHLNADIVAGNKIDLVQVKIEPIVGEAYASPWSFELTWEQYRGAKNTNVHKHFDIPENAVEGRYVFLLIVIDENGTKLEEKRRIAIYKAEALPVDPELSGFAVIEKDQNDKQIRRLYNILLPNSTDLQARKNQIISMFGNVSGVKGDGKMYFLMINKKHNHRPESIGVIDFSKAIVSDVWEHNDIPESRVLGSLVDASTGAMRQPKIAIGAENDNNVPQSPITGAKAWESGDYYFGVVYQNTTYNMGLFKYIEVKIDMD